MLYLDPTVSTDKVLKLLTNLKSLGTELHQFVLCKDEKVLVEISPSPYTEKDKRVVYSVSKSFSQAAIGICYDKGLVKPEDKIIKFFPEELTANSDERIKKLTVHDLLIMHTCMKDRMSEIQSSDDPLKTFFSQQFEEISDEYHYDNTASFMLSAIVKQVTGISAIDLLNKEFFPYIGVEDCRWWSVKGISEGYSGLHISARDIALSMQVYINNGVFGGRRLLSEEWVKLATTNHISTEFDNKLVWWTKGYGYQFWMNKYDGCRATGSCGQIGYIFPSLGVTAAHEGNIDKCDETDDAIYEFCSDFSGESTVKAEDIEKLIDTWYEPLKGEVGEFSGFGRTYRYINDFSFTVSRLENRESFVECIFSTGDYTGKACLGKGSWCLNEITIKNLGNFVTHTAPQIEKVSFAACCSSVDKDTLKVNIRFTNSPLVYELFIVCKDNKVELDFTCVSFYNAKLNYSAVEI